MDINSLNSISPVDGRYRNQTIELSEFFSEKALMRYRLLVEVEYLIELCNGQIPQLKNAGNVEALREIYKFFTSEEAQEIKEIERQTNHDVKALEYFLKDRLIKLGFESIKEFVHFGLTSQDINNTAIPLAVKDAVHSSYLPKINSVLEQIRGYGKEWEMISMLSHTHGQPASPTRLGKEMMVFVERLENQLLTLGQIPFTAKFGGATGNFNAHHVAYPEIDWKKFANEFVEKKLGLHRQQYTTQIEHYDQLCALFDGMKRINNILIDLSRDIWTYVSMDYFKQRIKSGEVGSSAMPHKVNPIDFENAEGNLGIANAMFEHLTAKLPISRLQRDLTDSTVLRNVGVPFAHTSIALQSITKGLNKLIVNHEAIHADLENNWMVISEGIQTILRRENFPNPYETLKELTRTHNKPTRKVFEAFIKNLNVSDSIKKELLTITPFNYTGIVQ